MFAACNHLGIEVCQLVAETIEDVDAIGQASEPGLEWRSTSGSTLRVRLGAAAAPLCARWLSAHLTAAGGEIRGHPATEGRLGVVVVLRVKPAANQLSSDAVRQI